MARTDETGSAPTATAGRGGDAEAQGRSAALRPGLLGRIRDRDHTRGSLLGSVVALSLPSVLTAVFGFGGFQLFELHFLGQLGDSSIAAAGATNQTLRQVFMLFSMGLTVASQMVIAQLVGMADLERAEHFAGQSFVLGAFLAMLGAVTVGAFPEFFVSLVATDPEIIAQGTTYVRIVFMTLIVMTLGQTFGTVLQGAGDAVTPMIITVVQTPVSILAQWAFAFGHLGAPALGIAGIAIGGVLGGVLGAMISLWALFSGRCRVHPRARHLFPDPEALKRLLGIAWQPAMHMVARSLMVIFFMTLSGRLGGKVQAAYTIGLRIEMLAIMVAFPIANACATLVGQNLGAGDLARARSAVWVSAAAELAVLWPAAVALFFTRQAVVGMFTQDPEVAAMASEYLAYASVILSFYGLYFVAFRTLQAAGDMLSPMLISVATAVLLGAPSGYYLATQADLGASGMWIANFVYAITNAVLMVGWLLTGRWTKRHSI
jgi:putative MATE family efflux protein